VVIKFGRLLLGKKYVRVITWVFW